MSTFNFNIQEKEFILKSISKRRLECHGEYNKHLGELDKIENELSLELSSLTPMNRSILIGCLRESYIYPNEDVLGLNDFELTIKLEELLPKLNEIDVALGLLNKLLKKSEKKYHLFSKSVSKINGMLNTDKVMYSSTTDGKIYKAAILVDKISGISFELDCSSEPTNFELGKLNPKSYMTEGTPVEVKNILTNYSLSHELTLMQKSFDKILDKVVYG